MPIARSMGCLMESAGYMAVYRQKDLTIGTTKEERQRSVETNAYINLLEQLAIRLGMIQHSLVGTCWP